jgi:hypothetical protein
MQEALPEPNGFHLDINVKTDGIGKLGINTEASVFQGIVAPGRLWAYRYVEMYALPTASDGR